ncbi:mobile mystery protein B [Oxalobacteraceae bacterium A2-2]
MGLIPGASHAPGATPLDPDEAAGLIPKHVTLQHELNEFEHLNILSAQDWALRRRRKDFLSEAYVRNLHKKMFNKTWRWAGTFRNSEKTIGVDPAHISVRLRDLLMDVQAWGEHATYPLDEQAMRLHHRLVAIHLFPNGNGRHARLYTDIFLHHKGATPFTWGQVDLVLPSATRKAYIAALQAADQRDYSLLRAFVRT